MGDPAGVGPRLFQDSHLQFLSIIVLEGEPVVDALDDLSLHPCHFSNCPLLEVLLLWQLVSQEIFDIFQGMFWGVLEAL